ncbi:MAG: hypothetical protein J7M39_05060, partial [Anaerolineae bacterium]|nr:hypothetical protein [Anaerolineae bacterium]
MAVSPGGDTLYAGGDFGHGYEVMQCQNSNNSWTPAGNPDPLYMVRALLCVTVGESQVLYAGGYYGSGGYIRSWDGSGDWVMMGDTIGPGELTWG